MIEKMIVLRDRLGIQIRAVGLSVFDTGGRKKRGFPYLAVKRANDQAFLRYLPKPYRGRLVIIRSKGSFAGMTSHSLGWSEIAKDNHEIHEIPVLPRGMLVEPFCRLLADTLNNCLLGR